MPKSALESAPEAARLLAALQHGDSFFPSGSVSFSWGLESLCAEGLVTDEAEVRGFVEGQLCHRWATCDRPALIATHRSGRDLKRVAAIDAELESLALPQGLRVGSRRAGGALLNAHERLETPQASDYRGLVKSGVACGHLPRRPGIGLAVHGTVGGVRRRLSRRMPSVWVSSGRLCALGSSATWVVNEFWLPCAPRWPACWLCPCRRRATSALIPPPPTSP